MGEVTETSGLLGKLQAEPSPQSHKENALALSCCPLPPMALDDCDGVSGIVFPEPPCSPSPTVHMVIEGATL